MEKYEPSVTAEALRSGHGVQHRGVQAWGTTAIE